MYRSMEPNNVDPPSTGFRLRGPAPPAGLLPFSRTVPGVAHTEEAHGAAFFDLDRTLLAGASGPAFSAAMRKAGMTSRSIPGEGILYGLFNLLGETLPSMAIARQGANLAKGRRQADFQAAGEAAADELAAMVQPFAGPIFDQHHAAGRPVVLATTTPYDLVRPLADRLALDDVVATRYGVNADGTYDGTIAGPFVWASGKLAAVRGVGRGTRRRSGRELRLLGQLLRHSAVERCRDPDRRQPGPAHGARGNGATVADPQPRRLAGGGEDPHLRHRVAEARAAVLPTRADAVRSFRRRRRRQHPKSGAAIVAANHRSYFDPAAMSVLFGKSGRTVRFLGKKEVFDVPVVGALATALGGIRVDRATGSDEPLEAAADALAGGEVVALMPQGTIPRGPAFFDPELKARWGAARLAHRTKAPVVPVGLWGTEKVWPRSSRLPNVLNLADPPVVRVRVGPPVELKYRSLDADTRRIMEAIVALLPDEAREPKEPTAEELAATYPPGYKGEPDVETERRPGRD